MLEPFHFEPEPEPDSDRAPPFLYDLSDFDEIEDYQLPKGSINDAT